MSKITFSEAMQGYLLTIGIRGSSEHSLISWPAWNMDQNQSFEIGKVFSKGHHSHASTG